MSQRATHLPAAGEPWLSARPLFARIRAPIARHQDAASVLSEVGPFVNF